MFSATDEIDLLFRIKSVTFLRKIFSGKNRICLFIITDLIFRNDVFLFGVTVF